MRSMIFALAAIGSLAAATGAAQAAGGCGPGFHPNVRGFCVRNFYRPYAYVAPRPYYRPYARCGIHVGPIGIGGPC